MRLHRLCFVAALLAAVVPVSSHGCPQQAFDDLMRREQRRQAVLMDCANMHPDVAETGGPDGVCAQSWKNLDQAEAALVGCLSDEQAQRLIQARDGMHPRCALLPRSVAAAQCGTNWGWLRPFDEKFQRRREESFKKSLGSVFELLKREESRQENLADCAGMHRDVILTGGPDGVCAHNWDFLSPAEADLSRKVGMSARDMDSFTALKVRYDASCQSLRAILKGEPGLAALCGADWSWLNDARSMSRMKDVRARVGARLP